MSFAGILSAAGFDSDLEAWTGLDVELATAFCMCNPGLVEDDRRDRHDHDAPGHGASNAGIQRMGEAEKRFFLLCNCCHS